MAYTDTTVDHVIPESLKDNAVEFAKQRQSLGLSEDFKLNDYGNWVPMHYICNSEKADWMAGDPLRTQRLLEDLKDKSLEAVKLAASINANSKKAGAIALIASALERESLAPDDVIDVLAQINVMGDADVRELQNEMSLKLAITAAKTHSKRLEAALFAVPEVIEPDRKVLLELDRANAGIIRLLPRFRYSECLLIREGGAYYSFVRLDHNYGQGSDICLTNNTLRTGFAGFHFGFFMSIGDVPISSLSTKDNPPSILDESSTKLWHSVWTYQPPTDSKQLRDEYQRYNQTGNRAGQLHSSAPVLEKQSYLLRSIDPGRSDVLVAVRVAQLMSDESVILDWKMLNRYPSPQRPSAST